MNQRGIANTILAVIMAIIITASVTVAVENYSKHQPFSKASTSVTVSPSPTATENASALAAVKAAYVLYNDGAGTQTYTAEARLRDSKLVTAMLAKYLDDIDKGNIRIGVDPMACAQDISDQTRKYKVIASSATTATVIMTQEFGPHGINGIAEASVDVVKEGNVWKLNALTCVPPAAQ